MGTNVFVSSQSATARRTPHPAATLRLSVAPTTVIDSQGNGGRRGAGFRPEAVAEVDGWSVRVPDRDPPAAALGEGLGDEGRRQARRSPTRNAVPFQLAADLPSSTARRPGW